MTPFEIGLLVACVVELGVIILLFVKNRNKAKLTDYLFSQCLELNDAVCKLHLYAALQQLQQSAFEDESEETASDSENTLVKSAETQVKPKVTKKN